MSQISQCVETFNSLLNSYQDAVFGVGEGFSGSVSEVASKAVEWSLAIASDDRYGYVSGGMGNGGYDCTQFVHAAYEAAGISLPRKGYVNNFNIVEYYTQNGFVWVQGPIDLNKMQPRDVLVNESALYIGNGGSQAAEIFVNNFDASYPWDCYLHYVGLSGMASV